MRFNFAYCNKQLVLSLASACVCVYKCRCIRNVQLTVKVIFSLIVCVYTCIRIPFVDVTDINTMIILLAGTILVCILQ